VGKPIRRTVFGDYLWRPIRKVRGKTRDRTRIPHVREDNYAPVENETKEGESKSRKKKRTGYKGQTAR